MNVKHITSRLKFSVPLCAAAIIVLTILVMPLRNHSYACDFCSCVPLYHGVEIPFPPGYSIRVPGDRTTIRGIVRDEHQITTDHIVEEFEDFEELLLLPDDPLNIETIFGRYIHPALMMMTEQLVHTAMFQMLIVGTLFDAKHQMEIQTVTQKLIAEAHRDYHPSHNMCVIGTNMRSLAEAERNYEYSTFVMSQRSMDRQMGNMFSGAARGQYDDHCFRLKQFRERYCNRQDNNDRMAFICDPVGSGMPVLHPECLADEFAVTADSENKDIDFTRTVDRANTLNIDFYSPAQTLSADEIDVFALGSNLYSGDVMFRLPESAMAQRNSQDEILDMRSVVAKRSVAEHSYNTIVGMKAMSKDEAIDLTWPYMRLILETMGLGIDGPFAEAEIATYLGDRPSYFAQMELLTKLVFQNPDFFTNLYDEPVNVERQGVALQAIGLMQDFDTWQSYLRTEAMLSVILELELLDLHNQVQNQLGSMRSGGFEL